jgi:hypothetical protein
MLGWAVAGWIAIMPLAIANGVLRQAVLIPRVGVRTAQPISGVLLMIAIAGVTWVMVGRIGLQRLPVWAVIGGGWLLATLAFEFGMGLSAGRSWDEMLAPYRFVDNNLWPIVLLWVVCAPGVVALMRRCTGP